VLASHDGVPPSVVPRDFMQISELKVFELGNFSVYL
jgi:hypothetical protein